MSASQTVIDSNPQQPPTSLVAAANNQSLENKALSLTDRAKQLEVKDQQTHDVACELLKTLKQTYDEIVEHHAESKKKAFEAHRAICAAEKKLLDPVSAAMQALGPRVAKWIDEQRRIQLERERAEREALERQAAEEIEAQAVEAEAQGASVEEIAAIVEQPVVVPKVYVEPTYTKANGVGTSTRFTCECFNPKLLCAEIAAGRQSVELIVKFDGIRGKAGLYTSPALNKLAVALKKTLNIPGCRAVPDTNIRIGGR